MKPITLPLAHAHRVKKKVATFIVEKYLVQFVDGKGHPTRIINKEKMVELLWAVLLLDIQCNVLSVVIVQML